MEMESVRTMWIEEEKNFLLTQAQMHAHMRACESEGERAEERGDNPLSLTMQLWQHHKKRKEKEQKKEREGEGEEGDYRRGRA